MIQRFLVSRMLLLLLSYSKELKVISVYLGLVLKWNLSQNLQINSKQASKHPETIKNKQINT